MKIIKPSYEILSDIDGIQMLKNIETAGRTCYKSENKISVDSSTKFVQMIVKNNHLTVIEHEIITVRFIFDRGVSHELVRHRLATYSQESSRFCNYSKDKFGNEITVVEPLFFDLKEPITDNTLYNKYLVWQRAMEEAEKSYFALIEKGAKPQEARSVLPNSLKTEIVITANLREWRLIFQQRTASVAHPQMREVMIPLLSELKEKIPVIFDDIIPK